MVLIKWVEALVAFLVKFASPRSEASFTIYESNQCFVQTKGRSITTVRANVSTVSKLQTFNFLKKPRKWRGKLWQIHTKFNILILQKSLKSYKEQCFLENLTDFGSEKVPSGRSNKHRSCRKFRICTHPVKMTNSKVCLAQCAT